MPQSEDRERRRLYHIHNNPKSDIAGARLKAMGMVAGISDLAFICGNGKTAYIEMKKPGGTQSPVQKKFEAVCKAMKVDYFLVYSVEQGQEIIERLR